MSEACRLLKHTLWLSLEKDSLQQKAAESGAGLVKKYLIKLFKQRGRFLP